MHTESQLSTSEHKTNEFLISSTLVIYSITCLLPYLLTILTTYFNFLTTFQLYELFILMAEKLPNRQS